MAAIHWNHH